VKAFEVSTVGGRVKGVKERKAGEYRILSYHISKMRKVKDEPQYTTIFCSHFNPHDWVFKAVVDGATVVIQGETWDREVDGKTYRTFEVSRLVTVDGGDKATASPAAPRSIQEPTVDHDDDDLPF